MADACKNDRVDVTGHIGVFLMTPADMNRSEKSFSSEEESTSLGSQ